MELKEFLEKVKRQHYYIDAIDAFILCDLYCNIYPPSLYGNNTRSVESDLIYMFTKLVKYHKMVNSDTTKRCLKCNEIKDNKCFRKTYEGVCHACIIKERKDKWGDYTPKEGYKVCKMCEKELPLENYGKDKSRYDGKNVKCLDCCRILQARHREKIK